MGIGNIDTMMNITEELWSLQDEEYKRFTLKIVPGLESERVIGVRAPHLRKMAKCIAGNPSERDRFIRQQPHYYHEENMLHAYILEILEMSIEDLLFEVDSFLPYVNNWAVCDIMTPKKFAEYPQHIKTETLRWLKSGETYKIRFALVVHLQYFLKDNFDEQIFAEIQAIDNFDYYVRMAIAWYYSYALVKQWDKTIKIIENRCLNRWLHNKSIQKACESRRITAERKALLRTKYRRKGEGVRHEM